MGKFGKSFFVRILVACILPAVFVWWILKYQDVNSLSNILNQINYGPLMFAVSVIPIIVVIRGIRIGLLTGQTSKDSLVSNFELATYHTFLVAILPGKLGELSLPLLLKKRKSTGLAGGAGVLLLIRVYDAVSLLLMSSTAVLILSFKNEFFFKMRTLAAVCTLGLISVALLLPRILHLILNTLGTKLPFPKLTSIIRELNGPTNFILNNHFANKILGCSLGLWTVLTTFFYLSSKSLNMNLPFLEMVVGTAGASFAFSVPLNGIANVGPVEAFWIYFLTQFHYSTDVALSFGIISHSTMLVGQCLLMTFVYLFFDKLIGRNRSR